MEIKRLSQYAKLCHQLGISQLTVGDVTMSIDLTHRQPEPEKKTDKPVVQGYTEEQLMTWSTGTGGQDFDPFV